MKVDETMLADCQEIIDTTVCNTVRIEYHSTLSLYLVALDVDQWRRLKLDKRSTKRF